ncbi:hypothetical protein [Bifidobacterium platyrrhinorum]|uniref:Uncharacterized protein n=1 Tax=Bifidobacterium platyrrhinorum TaxID=2661628 RepID=A0A6L9SQY8_9BIFI|nr:hypothetical protein [Bifidobacterium platyrrhinorum]NEG54585.1 hypothetical protein [Bifidobacterium platyrrhinorum]
MTTTTDHPRTGTTNTIPTAAATAHTWRRPALIALAAIILLELLVFNLPHWQTLTATPQTVHDDGTGNGLAIESGGTAVITDPDHAWRDISASHPIDYLYINHTNAERPHQGDAVTWKISTRKNTDSGWYDANAQAGYSPSSEHSRYQRIGDGATHIRIRYDMPKGTVIPYNTITANPRIPMRFSAIRLTLETLIALLIIACRPASPLHRTGLDPHTRATRIPIITCAALCCLTPLALLAMAAPQNSPQPVYWDTFASYQATDQYQKTADAILNGHTWLDYPVNHALAAMDNPYDTRQRTIEALNNPETPIYFDVAFHDGRYYSYFGVLPALLMFAPYKAITGTDLPTNAGVAIAATLATLATLALTIQLARLINRRRPVTTGATILAMTAATLGNGIPILIQLGLFYQIPQETAIACAALAIALWIEAKLRRLSPPWLAAGSLCMALTIASRPQVILATLIAIPLFADEIRELWRNGLQGGRALADEARVWACALAPYAMVFLPQFAYNAARFGGPLDFGASYNLTGYDMTHFRAPLTQYASFVFYYLFQPPNLTARFPFVQQQSVPLTTWRSEHPQFGGYLLTTAPFALLLFTAVVWRFASRRVAATRLVVGPLAAAGLVFLVDARVTGVDFRYEIDFVWMVMVAVTVLLYVVDGATNGGVGACTGPATTADGGAARGTILRADDWRDVTRRLVFGWFVAGVASASLFLFFKQFMDGMNMPTRIWWDTASWFLFV